MARRVEIPEAEAAAGANRTARMARPVLERRMLLTTSNDPPRNKKSNTMKALFPVKLMGPRIGRVRFQPFP